MKKNIAHIFPASLPLQQTRVLKMISAQREVTDGNIYFFSRSKVHNKSFEWESAKIYEIKSFDTNNFLKKITSNLIWSFRLFQKIKNKKLDIICCHSLTILPLCFLLKKIFSNVKLIYEPHEYETETIGISFFRKKISKFIEKVLIKQCDYLIFVTESIKNAYKKDYSIDHLRSIVITNATDLKYSHKTLKQNNYLREFYGIQNKEPLFLYIGIFYKARKIIELLEIFKKLENKHIIFFGYGDLMKLIKESAENYKNIHLHNPVDANLIPKYISGADVGFSLLEDNLNHKLTMPNKIFQYLNSNIPSVVSTNTESIKIKKEFDSGWIVDNKATKIRKLIKSLTFEEIKSKTKNIEKVLKMYSWNIEKEKIIKFYRNIFLEN